MIVNYKYQRCFYIRLWYMIQEHIYISYICKYIIWTYVWGSDYVGWTMTCFLQMTSILVWQLAHGASCYIRPGYDGVTLFDKILETNLGNFVEKMPRWSSFQHKDDVLPAHWNSHLLIRKQSHLYNGTPIAEKMVFIFKVLLANIISI